MFQFAKQTIIESLNYNQCHDFTYDKKNYYFTTNTNYIYKTNTEGVLEEMIPTTRNFHTIAFDEQHDCFWGTERHRTDILYQLDRELKEISYIQTRFQNIYRQPISFLSYCSSDNLFLIICNSSLNFIYQNDNTEVCTLSSDFLNLRSTVYGACAEQGVELYAARNGNHIELTAMNSSNTSKSLSILLPSDFQFKSIVMTPGNDEENLYLIKVLGVDSHQVFILEYTLNLQENADNQSDAEEAHTPTNSYPELITASEMDSYPDTLSISALQGSRCVQNSCCRPQPSNCCPTGCQNDKNCKDEYTRCCHCVSLEILETIACQEAALAHILNAEGEKIQRAVKDARNVEELLSVNDSVQHTIIESCHLELVLYSKLQCALSACKGECKCHCQPKPPCACDPKPCK